jgi:hypothetical protein
MSDTFPEGIINVQEMLMNNVLLRVIICEVFSNIPSNIVNNLR